MFKNEKIKKGVEDHFLSLFKTFSDESEWIRSLFREDDIDFASLNGSLNVSKSDNSFDWLNSVYGLNANKSSDWKDFTAIGAMKVKTKYRALIAHLMQDITQNGRVTGSLVLTPESDIEELINKGKLDFGYEISDEQKQKLIQDSEKALKNAESILLDNKQEAHIEKVYFSLVEDLARYGVCAMETGIRVDKKIRNYAPEVIEVPGSETNELALVPKPSFKESFIITGKRISPYDIFLDPDADGDPQAGVGVFKKEVISESELSRLMNLEDYDSDIIAGILRKYHGDKEEYSRPGSSRGVSSSPGTGSEVSSTKPFEVLTFWGEISQFDLDNLKGDSELVRSLIKKLKDTDNEFSHHSIQAILIDEELVYLTPLLTAHQQRPIAYGRMLPVLGTNYAQGLFSLARPVSRSMSRLFNRSVNNETIVGSSMFALDPKVIDESSLIFRPGGLIRTKPGASVLNKGNLSSALSQLQFNSTSQGLLTLFDKLDLILDEITMIPRNLVGVSDTSRKTATEVTQNLSSAQTILISIRSNFDKDIIQVDLEHTYHYLQNDPSTPNEAISDAYIEVFGAETFALKVMAKQMMQELLQIVPSLAQVKPELMSEINWTEILVSLLEGLNMDKSKFLNTPQLASQLENARAQLEQAFQQVEQMRSQLEEGSKELEKLSNENDDLKLKNYNLSSQSKVEAKLILEQVNTKNLQAEIKRLNEDLSEAKKACSSSDNKKTK